MDQEQLLRWLSLQATPGIGDKTLQKIIQHYGSIQSLCQATTSSLQSLLGQKASLVERALEKPLKEDQFAITLDWLAQPQHHILMLQDQGYPALLKEIPDPPPILYIDGDVDALVLPQLAIVGSRSPSTQGRINAGLFSSDLAGRGLVITSGMALGVDSAAHEGALKKAGLTLAIAGTGVDVIYPARHKELAAKISASGALVSEFPLGCTPRRENFPRRNRIISGLCLGVLVVEATVRSGSLITAHLAAEQGREVFAIPGSIHTPQARGCHRLIREGAKLIETAQDILDELGALFNYTTTETVTDNDFPDPQVCSIDSQSEPLLAYLGFDPVSVNELVERSGLTADVISSMLLRMELLGQVESGPGGRYIRAVN
ncbi:MAG: DNA-processing protein DprA [Acidiferrobacterales bacterium]